LPIADSLRIVKILDAERETPSIKTFFFEDLLCSRAKPGQFLMVWMPGVDEVPMSLSTIGGRSSVTVAKVGEATAAMHNLKVGDLVGVRGPYGNPFKPVGKRALVVGGGVGIAPLVPLTELLLKDGVETTAILGARTAEEIPLMNRLEALTKGLKMVKVTEDGSCGIRGLVTDAADRLMRRDRVDVVYTCGKELMMWKIYRMAIERGIRVQASLDRYMRCGMGLCGSCCVGGYRVCKEGPVFSETQLKEIEGEFGRAYKDRSGRKVEFSS